MPKLSYAGSRGYRRSPGGRSLDAHLCAQARTLRIRQTDGLNFSIARSTSPLPPLGSMTLFMKLRAPPALRRQTGKYRRPHNPRCVEAASLCSVGVVGDSDKGPQHLGLYEHRVILPQIIR